MLFKNRVWYILFLIVLVIYFNTVIPTKYTGGFQFIETYEIKLKKSKDNYRIIIHNIIRMEQILKYNNEFSNNNNFTAKLNYLKLKKNKEYSNLINILGSIRKAKIINNEFKKEEKKSAKNYARNFTAKQIQLKNYSNTTYYNIDNEINNIKLLENKDV